VASACSFARRRARRKDGSTRAPDRPTRFGRPLEPAGESEVSYRRRRQGSGKKPPRHADFGVGAAPVAPPRPMSGRRPAIGGIPGGKRAGRMDEGVAGITKSGGCRSELHRVSYWARDTPRSVSWQSRYRLTWRWQVLVRIDAAPEQIRVGPASGDMSDGLVRIRVVRRGTRS